jgi:hypothetical protein
VNSELFEPFRALSYALLGKDQLFTTDLVLQELLQGFAGPGEQRKCYLLPRVRLAPQEAIHGRR